MCTPLLARLIASERGRRLKTSRARRVSDPQRYIDDSKPVENFSRRCLRIVFNRSASEPQCSSTLGPGDTLREWLLELAQFSATTRGVADTLVLGSEPDPVTSACEAMLVTAATSLYADALKSEEISSSVSALDLLALVNSISLGARTAPDPAEYAARLLTIALSGVRR